MEHGGPKAIETVYAGYRFRSRLEARWAVFFDYVGVTWNYEEEGYEFEDGTRYLPDFYLPSWQAWVEIKREYVDLPEEDAQAALRKGVALCGASGRAVLVVFGPPDMERYAVAAFLPELRDEAGWARTGQFDNCARCGALCFEFSVPTTGGMATVLRPLAIEAPFSTCRHDRGRIGQYSPVERGLEEARHARFEFGEHGGRRQARFEHGESGGPRR